MHAVKIAIIGAGGFIGTQVASYLQTCGHSLNLFGRSPPPAHLYLNSQISDWYVGDASNPIELNKCFRGVEVVLHLASTTTPITSEADPDFDLSSNTAITASITSAARQQGIRKIIFLSSGGTVYGEPQYLPVDEKHPTNPKVSYGNTKIESEKILLAQNQHESTNNIILRVSNPYGPSQVGDRLQGVVGVFIHKALMGDPISVWGDGDVIRDYLYIDDLLSGINAAINYGGNEAIFNIASGRGASLNQIIELIEKYLQREIQKEYGVQRAFDVKTSVLDIQKAKSELQWEPKISLEDGVFKTLGKFFNHFKSSQ